MCATSKRVTRRAFLAGVAASTAVQPLLAHTGFSGLFAPVHLHLADCSSSSASIHSYRVSADQCDLLGTTVIDSFAAYTSHPIHPVLYVARDCSHWEHLPRGVVETYAVECSSRPLRLLAQTPMSLSAAGPRSIAISHCGRHLLLSASRGGAWNTFILDADGIPASVAIARKETGILEHQNISLPAPGAIAFSPHGPYAVGTDLNCERMTLLQPSSDRIAILSRCSMPSGDADSSPVWTSDGGHIVAANAQAASLSIYAIHGAASGAGIHFLDAVQTGTRINAMLAHPSEPGIVTSRTQAQGSHLELWKLRDRHLRVKNSTWIPAEVTALAQHDGILWLVSKTQLIRMRSQDLRIIDVLTLPRHGTRAIITQT